MIRMLWIPFATVYVFRAWWQVSGHSRGTVDFGVVSALLAVAIYPPLIAWIGFHQGMRRRSQTQATLVTLGLLVAWCVLPILVAELIVPRGAYSQFGTSAQDWGNTSFYHLLRWLSPACALTFPAMNSGRFGPGLDQTPFSALLAAHFVFAGGLLVYLRSRGMRDFAKHVNRNDGQIVDDDDIDRLASIRKLIVGGGVFRDQAGDE